LLLWLADGRLVPLQGPVSARTRWSDAVLFLALTAIIMAVVFIVRPLDEFTLFYLMFLPMIAVTMRYGVHGAAAALPVVQVFLLVGLEYVVDRASVALNFQLRMLTLSVTALYLGMLAAERERSAARAAAQESALREQRAALSEAQRSASAAELAAALAHDLSQPLSAIGAYARACRMLAERNDTETLRKTLEQIEVQSARAGKYVRRMRDFFRAGIQRVERIDVQTLVENSRALIAERLAKDGIGWTSDVPQGMPPVVGDAVQIGAILGNLLTNACDAVAETDGPRCIDASAEQITEGGRVMVNIRIRDSGGGIPADLQAQLFSPLATTKPHGMGLGLALSRSIAERQQGRLWFDAGDTRTAFCLTLPAAEAVDRTSGSAAPF
jgi:C4-dicarboxylate-specific signal transduction histidine kinase